MCVCLCVFQFVTIASGSIRASCNVFPMSKKYLLCPLAVAYILLFYHQLSGNSLGLYSYFLFLRMHFEINLIGNLTQGPEFGLSTPTLDLHTDSWETSVFTQNDLTAINRKYLLWSFRLHRHCTGSMLPLCALPALRPHSCLHHLALAIAADSSLKELEEPMAEGKLLNISGRIFGFRKDVIPQLALDTQPEPMRDLT